MTRKRFVKLLMKEGLSRNEAQELAALDMSVQIRDAGPFLQVRAYSVKLVLFRLMVLTDRALADAEKALDLRECVLDE